MRGRYAPGTSRSHCSSSDLASALSCSIPVAVVTAFDPKPSLFQTSSSVLDSTCSSAFPSLYSTHLPNVSFLSHPYTLHLFASQLPSICFRMKNFLIGSKTAQLTTPRRATMTGNMIRG